MPKKRVPKYALHRPTGQARVRIDGKDHYLGTYGSPESRQRYELLIAQRYARVSSEDCGLTIDLLCLRFLAHADAYYVKNGRPTNEPHNFRIALRHLIADSGPELVASFRAVDLKRVRSRMVEAGWVRSSINKHVGRIRHLFRWGVSEGIAPAITLKELEAVLPLKRGRTEAKESERVRPVTASQVKAIEPFASRQIWAMVQLQLLTGMRPGEVRQMRQIDIEKSERVWIYRPTEHKTEHHGHDRVVCLGPKAQQILIPFLTGPTDRFLFRPEDARREFDDQRKEKRVTKQYGAAKARVTASRKSRLPGQTYSINSYCRAIARACTLAGIDTWSPNQLRHSAATEIRKVFGLEASQVILGHAKADITQVYAERDLAKAIEVAFSVG